MAHHAIKVDVQSDSIRAVSIKEFLQRSTPYETWITPLDRQLQLSCWCALAIHALSLAFVWKGVPVVLAFLLSRFSLVLGETFAVGIGYAQWILLVLSYAGIVSAPIVWVRTNLLQSGTAFWHIAAFVFVVVAGLEVFILSLTFLAVLSNALALIVISVVIVAAILLAVLLILARTLGIDLEL